MNTPAHHTFNLQHIRAQQHRHLKSFHKSDFLFKHAENDILDRLHMIKRSAENTALIGNRLSEEFKQNLTQQKNIQACIETDFVYAHEIDSEILNIQPNNCDMALSLLALHSTNDLTGALIQIKNSLKKDGFFIGALFGGETLYELRQSLMQAELELYGGASPRVFPFADKQQIGALLQRAGYSLPVVDSEIIQVSYKDIFTLMRDLRHMGESNSLTARKKSFSGKNLFLRANEIYHESFADTKNTTQEQRIIASFEIIYMIGWAPHESQPKPLRAGSAQTSLTDVL